MDVFRFTRSIFLLEQPCKKIRELRLSVVLPLFRGEFGYNDVTGSQCSPTIVVTQK